MHRHADTHAEHLKGRSVSDSVEQQTVIHIETEEVLHIEPSPDVAYVHFLKQRLHSGFFYFLIFSPLPSGISELLPKHQPEQGLF